jgi:20S proteasome alpha/beta subunit
MSLIIVLQSYECQLWCSDSLSVQYLEQETLKETFSKKIYKLHNYKILMGVSGNRYDSEVIRKLLSYHKQVERVAMLLNDVATIVSDVNMTSREHSNKKGFESYPTGLMIGGYLKDKDFLSVVTPNGEIFNSKHYAAIGEAARYVSSFLKEKWQGKGDLDCMFDIMTECFLIANKSLYVNNILLPLVVSKNTVYDFSTRSMNIHSEIQSLYIEKLKKEICCLPRKL